MSVLPSGTSIQNENVAPTPPASSGGDSAVRQQLERVLASTHFRNSKRYPALLRYVVERTLDGASSSLKERSIGVDVFGRDASYDLSSDPVVRITAGEVRKRLAQYYQEADHHQELRIELPLGSYLPEFSAIEAAVTSAVLPVLEVPIRQVKTRHKVFAAVAAGILLCGIWGAIYFQSPRTPLDLFWRPVINSGAQVMLCVGHGFFPSSQSSAVQLSIEQRMSSIAWWDAETFARLAGLIQGKGAALRLVREDQVTFNDFQQSPAILIGAFNDRWTIQLMKTMRFTFERAGSQHWIADRDHPSARNWAIDVSQMDSNGRLAIRQDYAIISRVANPRTGRITVTVAGLWGSGTVAAGHFLTDPAYLKAMSSGAPHDWDKRNIQIVIGAEVIQGISGPPKVLAMESW